MEVGPAREVAIRIRVLLDGVENCVQLRDRDATVLRRGDGRPDLHADPPALQRHHGGNLSDLKLLGARCVQRSPSNTATQPATRNVRSILRIRMLGLDSTKWTAAFAGWTFEAAAPIARGSEPAQVLRNVRSVMNGLTLFVARELSLLENVHPHAGYGLSQNALRTRSAHRARS